MSCEKLTRQQIETLQAEAGAAGDVAMVRICERAIDGHPLALQSVADAIAEAKAMDDSDKSYSLAFVKADGSWDIVQTFSASDNDAAKSWADRHYAGQDWYVLDSDGRNINGGVDG